MDRDTGVSVIVPCYNYGRFLKDCVGSVLAQIGVDLRVLILDDASTDNSAQLAAELVAADSRVELRVHGANQGHISTYNEGLGWAGRTYTVLIDADDMLTEGSLRRACDLLDAHPEVGFVYGRARVFYGDRQPRKAGTAQPTWTIWKGREWFEIRCRLTENCIRQPEVVMRTSTLKKAGGFRAELPHAADMEMWIRLALHADVGFIDGPAQAFYRDHPAGLHRQQFGTKLADLAQVTAAFEMLFGDHSHMTVNSTQLWKSVKKTVAQRALDLACREYDTGHPNMSEVAALEALAGATYEDAKGLCERQHLRWRKTAGPKACLLLRPFLLATTASRILRLVRRYRLHQKGLL